MEGDGKRRDYAPAGMSEDEKSRLLRMDIRQEFHKVSQSLEDFHGIFSQLWSMGYPVLTFDIPTACVRFSRDSNRVEFMFNPILWQKLDLYTKSFVVGHECLHAMLNHGIRTRDCPLPRLANIALDIVVNHMLVNKFGFCRAEIDFSPLIEGQMDEQGKQAPHKNFRGEDIVGCWIDTVFKDLQGEIKRNKSFEYYYNLLEQNVIIITGVGGSCSLKLKGKNGEARDSVGGQIIDGHDHLEDFNDEEIKENIAETLNERLTEEEKQDFSDKVMKSEEGKAAEKSLDDKKNRKAAGQQAGSLAGRISYKPPSKRWMKKKKWETVIRRWARRYYSEEVTAEQWARCNRRMMTFGSDIVLPHDVDNDDREIERIDVYFFLDVSGSCWHLKDRFIAAAMSLPPERFNIKLFCFDTEVHPIDIKNPQILGGGGTAFDIIENRIQHDVKSGTIPRYPDGVFLITDGYGNKVSPERPDRWYWFLSVDYKEWIPGESLTFMLEDYE